MLEPPPLLVVAPLLTIAVAIGLAFIVLLTGCLVLLAHGTNLVIRGTDPVRLDAAMTRLCGLFA